MEHNDIEKIAIIGMAGRFPGASTIDAFWDNLVNGVESIEKFSREELLAAGESPELLDHPDYVNAGTRLENAFTFDAPFFGFSPKEAVSTDPQHRLFLEVCWEALENSGYVPSSYPGAIAVFGGTSNNGYAARLYHHPADVNSVTDRFQVMMGTDPDFLATRVAYKLDLKGPAQTIQTACSTSLVAVHHACQSLLTYQCDVALSGGVCVQLNQCKGYLFKEGMIFSPDGHCRAFDADAQGTVFGQGAGIVVLKRLSEAIADGDTIHAVIVGSAINNDGALKVGFTAPSVDGQAEVISLAQAVGDIEAETIGYVETHGTGTLLGDPIEIEGLTKAFRQTTEKKNFCAIGSVKTNLGHLDSAAGVAGLIKTVLALKNKQIPPSLHFTTPNPNIDFGQSPFYVNTALKNWPESDHPRRGAVSSFGIGGTNAHVVLEEPPPPTGPKQAGPYQLLLLSARSKPALEAMTANLAAYLDHTEEIDIADVAYTLQCGRKAFQHRRIAVCETCQEAIDLLSSLPQDKVLSSQLESAGKDIVFMFSGQGSQYINMTRELYDKQPYFRRQIEECTSFLQQEMDLNLLDILFPEPEKKADAEKSIQQTHITQPALFVIEYALARMLMHLGIRPAAMVGHSIGEYVAACLAGVFSLEDALRLVVSRGRLMQSVPPGSMLSISLSAEEAQPYLTKRLSLALVNSKNRCVVSGEDHPIQILQKELEEKEIDCQILKTSHAFHSSMMEPILGTFLDQLRQFQMNPPVIPFTSNVSGTWISDTEACDPQYWVKHLRQTVNFFGCLQTLLENENRILLEVGPGQVLNFLAKQHPAFGLGHIALASTRRPVERRSDFHFFLQTLGQLWLAGQQIDWSKWHDQEIRQRIPLPSYPFERKTYLAENPHATAFSQQCKQAAAPIHNELVDPPGEIYQDTHVPQQPQIQPGNLEYSDVKQIVSDIWKNLLVGVENIEPEDNFFDLGGDSLQAVQVSVELEKISGIKIPLSTIYDAPCLKDFAKHALQKVSTKALEASDSSSAFDTTTGAAKDNTTKSTNTDPGNTSESILKKVFSRIVFSPLESMKLLQRLLLGTWCIVWYRITKRNVRIKFPFIAYSMIKITGPGKVFIDSGCSTAVNALDRPTIVTMNPDAVVTIGKKCALAGMTIRCKGRITIGDATLLPGCLVQDFLFHSDDSELAGGNKGEISIGNNAWLAMQSAVLPGSIIGNGSVLSVQAVTYNQEISPFSLAYGNLIERILPIE